MFDATGDQREAQMMAFSHDMSLLAVASSDGCYIRVIDLNVKECKIEFCRGKSTTIINSINFVARPEPESYYLACCSDTTTCHIFEIANGETKNSQSMFKSIGSVMSKYYSASFSAIKFNVPQTGNELSKKICTMSLSDVPQGQEARLKLFVVHELSEPKYVEAERKGEKME